MSVRAKDQSPVPARSSASATQRYRRSGAAAPFVIRRGCDWHRSGRVLPQFSAHYLGGATLETGSLSPTIQALNCNNAPISAQAGPFDTATTVFPKMSRMIRLACQMAKLRVLKGTNVYAEANGGEVRHGFLPLMLLVRTSQHDDRSPPQGASKTDMLRSALSQAVGGDPEKVKAAMTGYAGMVPLGRVRRPQEAAEAAFRSLSDAASYVTAGGQAQTTSGGSFRMCDSPGSMRSQREALFTS